MKGRCAGLESLLRRGRGLLGLRFGVVGCEGGLCERRRRRFLPWRWVGVVVGWLLGLVAGYLVARASS